MPDILIVDDHPLTRRGIAVTIAADPDLEVAGEARDGHTAVEWLSEHTTDLVTVDLSLPDMSGFELVRQIMDGYPDVRVLVISHFENATCAGRALREGARGFVGKSEETDVLSKAVHRILEGGIYVSRPIQDRLLRDLMSQNDDGQSPLEVLSTRELDVFEMTGEGMGTREIAERLNLSVKTVESYRRRVRAKLKLPSNPRLMQEAVRWIETRSKC